MLIDLTSKSLLRSLAAAAATAAIAGAVVFGSAGIASADETLTLNYDCSFPLIGTQTVAVQIDANLPTDVPAGTPTPSFTYTAVVNVPASAAFGLQLVGAKSVSGTATANASIQDGSTTVPESTDLTIPSTAVPSSGTFTVTATGTSTPVTLPEAGTATVTVGDFSTTLTPVDANGNPTGLGTFTSDCTQEAGQNNVLGTITVD
jgi:hypothetical protein